MADAVLFLASRSRPTSPGRPTGRRRVHHALVGTRSPVAPRRAAPNTLRTGRVRGAWLRRQAPMRLSRCPGTWTPRQPGCPLSHQQTLPELSKGWRTSAETPIWSLTWDYISHRLTLSVEIQEVNWVVRFTSDPEVGPVQRGFRGLRTSSFELAVKRTPAGTCHFPTRRADELVAGVHGFGRATSISAASRSTSRLAQTRARLVASSVQHVIVRGFWGRPTPSRRTGHVRAARGFARRPPWRNRAVALGQIPGRISPVPTTMRMAVPSAMR